MLALEGAADELAEQLGLDPIELRRRNEPMQDPEKQVPYSTRNLIPCLEEGARPFGWERRQANPGQTREGRWLIGMGVASASRGVLLQPSKCRLVLNPDGSAVAELAMTDIGTGSYTILTQIGADLLGLPPKRVTVRTGRHRLSRGRRLRRILRRQQLRLGPSMLRPNCWEPNSRGAPGLTQSRRPFWSSRISCWPEAAACRSPSGQDPDRCGRKPAT